MNPNRRATQLAIGGLISLAVAMGIGRFVYTPILPDMLSGVPLTEGQAGLIAGANFLGYLVGALAAIGAWLGGTHRGLFFAGLFTSAVTTGAMALVDTVIAFSAIRLIGGIASAFVLVFASALILDRLTAMGRPGLSTIFFPGVGFGIAISAVFIWALGEQGFDWRAQWVFSGAVSLAAAAVVVLLVPAEDNQTKPQNVEHVESKPGAFRRLTTAYGLYGFGYIITATFISTIARSASDGRGLEALVWLVVGLAAIPSVAFWVWVGRRWGLAGAFAIACAVEAGGVALSVLWPTPSGLVISGFILGGTFVGIASVGLLYAYRISTEGSQRALAIMTTAFAFGQMVGPLFAGATFDIADSFLIPSLAATAALAASAVIVWRDAAR